MKATSQLLLLCAAMIITTFKAHAQLPKLNSYPAAPAAIFLDFDGQYVTGTSWNWGGPIAALPSGLSTDAILEVFNRVAEDCRPFNINVTTDSTVFGAAPYNKRARLIITTSSQWYGRAGGVAFVGSFNFGDDTPAWVFSELLGYRAKNIAEACSHEAGHTLGLQHQSTYDSSCSKIFEYNEGQGEGEIGWAPIMGMGYYKNLTTWHRGSNSAGCNIFQNDLDIIANNSNIGFRTDDHENSVAHATTINLAGQNFLVNGLINRPGDIDAFKLQLHQPANLRVNAVPLNVGAGNKGANIDIEVIILNAFQDTIGKYNPSDLLDAGIDTSLNDGEYYIIVKPTGNINHSDYGSLGYYSLSGNLAIALPIHQFVLKGIINNGKHFFNWSYVNDEPVKNVILEASADGIEFQSLVSLHAGVKNFSYQSINANNYYRLKAITVAGAMTYYSNIISLRNTNEVIPVKILSNLVRDNITIRSDGNYFYQLFNAGGKLLQKGKLVIGINRIDVGNAADGILFLRLNNSVDEWMHKLIKQ